MTQLSKERLKQYAFDDRMCNVNDEIREMARRLLAAEAQEPVGYTSKHNIDNVSGSILEFFSKDPDIYSKPIALYTAPQPVVVPDGWKLVPVELTGGMTNAMTDAILADLHNVDVWRGVLAAAPQPQRE